jgi:hypothetical protein
MFVADCWGGHKKDMLDVFYHKGLSVYFIYCDPSIVVRDENYDSLLSIGLPFDLMNFYSAIGHFKALIEHEREIKSALGLQ